MSGAGRSRTEVGRRAEDAAAAALRAEGYEIVERNYRSPVGELDIVARVDGLWVFVEVRSRTSDRFGTPAESVGAEKRRRLMRTARHYLAHRPFRGEPACRFDVVTVRLDGRRRPGRVEIIRNAFQMN